MKLILSLLLLLATSAQAVETVLVATPIDALGAGTDRTSDKMKTTRATHGSFHCTWASLTGTTDGQFVVEASNNNGASWIPKTVCAVSAAITVATTDGDEMISLNGSVSEEFYRVRWVKNNVSGGTVTCRAIFKG